MSKPARKWVQHVRNGSVGWLVRKAGQVKVKLDRADPYALRPYDAALWQPMTEVTKLNRMHVAHVQWVAERELLRVLGYVKESRKQWEKMPDHERIKYMDEGPQDGPELALRKELWAAVRKVTDALIEGRPAERAPE